jgi:signal transduction histidine kinase
MADTNQQFPREMAPAARWSWRGFPWFWLALFVLSMAPLVASLITRHPTQLQGWSGVAFVALLLGVFGAYARFCWGALYGDHLSERAALLVILVQLACTLLLVWHYDQLFAWMIIAAIYQVIGGLPRRRWPLPLAGVVLVILASLRPGTGASLDLGELSGFAVLVITNVFLALILRALFTQRAQLRQVLDDLGKAHAELAARAEQQEELAMLRERARLARAMHDDIGHALVLLNIRLEAAQLLYAQDPARGAAELEATRVLIRATMADLRRAIADLRAPAAAYDDLPASLGQLVQQTRERTGIEVAYSVTDEVNALPPATREALWYVAREALANVERHAGAASASLMLKRADDGWLLRITDDGSGIDPSALRRPGHYGLLGMCERVKALGGVFDIRPGPRGGTIVEARLPAAALLS